MQTVFLGCHLFFLTTFIRSVSDCHYNYIIFSWHRFATETAFMTLFGLSLI